MKLNGPEGRAVSVKRGRSQGVIYTDIDTGAYLSLTMILTLGPSCYCVIDADIDTGAKLSLTLTLTLGPSCHRR